MPMVVIRQTGVTLRLAVTIRDPPADDGPPTGLKTMQRMFARLSALMLVAVLLAISTGCTALPLGMVNQTDKTNMPPDQFNRPREEFLVEMHRDFGSPKQYVGELSGDLTVEQVLHESGASNRYRGMQVDIFRKIDNGQVLHLPVNYEGRSKTVLPEQNYAIHAGDRVVVRPKSGNPLEKVLEDVLGATD